MCGIAGLVMAVSGEFGPVIDRMTGQLRHRGPDGQGFVVLEPGRPLNIPAAATPPHGAGRVFFGHRRLSIIDPRGTAQPLRNEDGSVWVTFNGEIYNYRELGDWLRGRGHRLREKGDTEILVHLYEECGAAMFSHLNGMFALAVYDVRRDILLLGRDRYGEKPLYYLDMGDVFAFASELQGLWPVPGFPAGAVDPMAVAQYFRYGYIPSPRTIYPDVRVLPPGHSLLRGGEPLAYWKPEVVGSKPRLAVDEVGELLDAAVASRLVSDVPVVCFLSGGLDSSLVAESMRRAGSLATFTIATGGPDDESAVAAATAQALGADHHEFRVEPDFVAVAARLARHYGQPFADYSCVPTYHVCRETSRLAKVALSGDGGDELFAGYERYANLNAATVLGRFGGSTARMVLPCLATRLLPGGDGRSHLVDFLASAWPYPAKGENLSSLFHGFWAQRCFTEDFCSLTADAGVNRYSELFVQATSCHPLERCLETDQRMYLADDILTKVDIASMAVSLETRAPFLDHRLAERINRQPLTVKLQGRHTKVLLRELARKRLPPGLSKLPKRGFGIPLASWMRGDIRDWCQAALFDSVGTWERFLRPEAVAGLWRAHQAGRADHAMRLWAVIAWGLWRRALDVPREDLSPRQDADDRNQNNTYE